jgi:hypothetical protein
MLVRNDQERRSYLQLVLSSGSSPGCLGAGRAGGGTSGVVARLGRLGRNRRSALSRLRSLGGSGSGRLGDGRRRRRGSLSSSAGSRLDLTSGGAGRSSSDLGGGACGGSGSVGGNAKLLLDQVGVVSKAVSGLGSSAVDVGGGSAVGRGSSGGCGVPIKSSTVLAGKSNQLVTLGTLGNLDAVLVGPLLDLRVRPRVEKSIAQALLSGGGGRRGLGVNTLSVLAGEAGLATEAGDERVTGRGLGDVVATLIEPRLEVRVGPGSVDPVTGVVGSLRSLLSDRLVVLANRLQKRVALAGLRDGNAVLVGEGLQLRVGPAVEC